MMIIMIEEIQRFEIVPGSVPHCWQKVRTMLLIMSNENGIKEPLL